MSAQPFKTMRIGVDVDGVLANFGLGMVEALRVVGCTTDIPVDAPDFPAVWDWFPYYGIDKTHVEAAYELIRNDYTFWVRLAPLVNARDDLRLLYNVFNNGHEVYFLTTRFGNRAKFQTESWLAMRGILCPTVLIADSPTCKGELARGLKLDAMIDDRPDNLLALPANTMPFIYKAPYNREWREHFPGLAWACGSVTEMIEVIDKGQIEQGRAA